ncbi:MAG: CpsB/CapC family capsule biosynthesis tyrosine phosphatase [Bacteroidota bacterium]
MNDFSIKKKAGFLKDFSVVKTDLHSHLIPGLDDGSETIGESIEIIKRLSQLGYKKLITTPHVINNSYNNSNSEIHSGLEKLKKEIIRHEIDIDINAAAEYYTDFEFLDKIQKQDLLTFGNKKYVLFETSSLSISKLLFEAIFLLHTYGYVPVLAHPERYHYFHNEFSFYHELKSKGVLFQMNIVSLLGTYSPGVKKNAEKMIKNNMIDFIGSDAHNIQYINAIESLINNKDLNRLINSGKLLNPLL